MKAYLPFGDPSNDGHGQCKMVLVEVPHLTAVSEAEQRIKEKYDQWFFSGFAEDCNEPFLSEDIWKALIETDYPIERFRVKEDSNDWEDVNSLAEARQLGLEIGLPEDLVLKTPSDGLCGQSDEDKLGFTYEQLDDYINEHWDKVPDDVCEKIKKLHMASRHKYKLIPTFWSYWLGE